MHILLLDMPSGGEWILIFMAILVLFGGNKIPEFMRGLGKGIREFNDAKNNIKEEIEAGLRETPKPAQDAVPAPASTAAEASAPAPEFPAPASPAVAAAATVSEIPASPAPPPTDAAGKPRPDAPKS